MCAHEDPVDYCKAMRQLLEVAAGQPNLTTGPAADPTDPMGLINNLSAFGIDVPTNASTNNSIRLGSNQFPPALTGPLPNFLDLSSSPAPMSRFPNSRASSCATCSTRFASVTRGVGCALTWKARRSMPQSR